MENPPERTEVNKEIYEEVRGQLESLFSGFFATSPQYRAYFQASNQIVERAERINSVLQALTDSIPLLEKGVLPLRFLCVHRANTYLFYIELIGNYYVNLALLLLVGRGEALHLEPDREHRYIRHATSLEDIESPALPLSVKLDLLKSNGLPFFRKWINTKLRNGIAHSDFDINEKGEFFLIDAKGRKKRVDIIQKLIIFTEYHKAVVILFNKYLYGKITPTKFTQ